MIGHLVSSLPPNLLLDYVFSRKVVPVFGHNDQTFVVGMQVAHRADLAPEVQSIITKYGGDIVGRFGVPSFDKDRGMIVLLMHEAAAVDRLTDELKGFSDLQIKAISFD